MNGPGEVRDPALAPARDPLVGSVINGKFHIHRAIARGGMGKIYYATQAPLDRPVALKVVLTEGHNPEEVQNFLGRFLQEASILAKLQHPNVVTLFDYGKIESGAPVSGEMYFIAMEYLAGETLSARLKQRNYLATPEVLYLTRQIARGLREAHSRGVVHRDLKPSNIILVPEGDGGELVKIVDFGIGKVVAVQDVTKDLTQEGMMVGTPRYMAPEQFEGTASPASDIYALGTIAYQALAGSLPFHGATLPEFMVAKFAHAIPPISHVNPEAYLPEALEALVLQMLARNPAERPALEDLFAQLSHCEHEVFGHSHGSNTGPSAMRRTGQNMAMSGSGPRLTEPSRVPPTMVQPIPQIPGGMPGVGYGTLGMTPRPMSTSMRPQASQANRNGGARLGVVLALVLGLVGAGAVGIYAVKKSRTPTASAATTISPNDGPPPAATLDPTFSFLIDSAPPGATVMEGDKTLGVTPLTLPIERAAVATAPRTFIIKKDGYVSVNVVQGLPTPSDEKQAKQMVTLAADTAASKTTGTKPGSGHGPGPGPAKPPGVKPGGGSDLDIRLNR